MTTQSALRRGVERISDLDDRPAQPATWSSPLQATGDAVTSLPSPATPPSAAPRRQRPNAQIFASVVVIAAVLLLWLAPSAGVVATSVVMFTLAPWGRSLGERAVITTVVVSGAIAIQLAAMTATGVVLVPVGWRLVVTGCLLLVGVSLWLKRSAPVWPTSDLIDVIGLLVAGSVVALMGIPLLGLSATRTLGGLLRWWDHSSHLPMFAQVMQSRSWSFTPLGNDVYFDHYPMLHVGIWSVSQWLTGGQAPTGGLGLVQPYVVCSILTTALSAALLVWASGLLGRAVSRGDLPRFRQRAVPVFAAVITGTWCLVGTLTTMADFAFVNFILGGALCVSAVAVSVQSRAAMMRVGWFVMPLSTVATAYLYPPVAGGAGFVSVLVLLEVARHRRDRLIAMIVVSAVCVIAALPSLGFLSAPFHGRDPGSISGGIPTFEVWIALLLVPIVIVLVVDWRRRIGTATALGMLVPIVLTCGVAVDFAVQAGAADVALNLSYYTLKIVYAMLLAIVPLASAVGARALLSVLRGATTRQSLLASGLLLPAAIVAVVAATALSVSPTTSGTLPRSFALPGVTEFGVRMAARDANLDIGRVTAFAALHPSAGHWTTIPMISAAGWNSVHMSSKNIEAARMATGLGSVNTSRGDVVLSLIVGAASTRQPLRSLEKFLFSNDNVAIRFIVSSREISRSFLPLLQEFGPTRIQILVATP